MISSGLPERQRLAIDTRAGRVTLDRVGEGPDLVLLHSLLSDRHVFDPVLPGLARTWRVNLVDLPGFGDTARVEPAIDAYADLVGALLAEARFDPSSTALGGNGLGGFVALGTAIRHGDRFGRLLLVGCGPGFPPPAKGAFESMAAAAERGGMAAVAETAVRRIFTEAYLAEHPEQRAERVEVLLRTDPAAFADACRALREVDYHDRLGGVGNPSLVVVGSEDAATPPALAGELVAGMPDARLVELHGLAHAPQLQDPAAFLRAVGPFLDLS